jgi:hypothetical protein
MKQEQNSLETFALMPILSDYAAAEGLSLADGASLPTLLDHLKHDVQGHVDNSARMFGLRTEAMFAYVAASLSSCRLVTQEDSGIVFARDSTVRRPDFRLVTDDDQFLVEVKNFHQSDPRVPFKIKPEYAASLRRYAAMVDCRLMIAVFWSRWKIWTLVDAAHIPSDGNLHLGDALKMSEMGLIGDSMISTVPPLSVRFTADATKQRTLDSNGQVNFTIGAVDVCANGTAINDPLERKLAWFFMLYGQWTEVEQPAEVVNGELEHFEITMNPPEPPVEHPFSSLGFLSQMVSQQYIDLTSEGRNVKLLAPDRDPNDLGVLIPRDFTGETLKLWRFQMQPNLDELKTMESSQQDAWTATNQPRGRG